jgi:hypothetical protein
VLKPSRSSKIPHQTDQPMLFVLMSFVELLRERGCKLRRISREANSASHELARLGRVQGRTKVWLRECPPEVSEAIANDCNSSTE